MIGRHRMLFIMYYPSYIIIIYYQSCISHHLPIIMYIMIILKTGGHVSSPQRIIALPPHHCIPAIIHAILPSCHPLRSSYTHWMASINHVHQGLERSQSSQGMRHHCTLSVIIIAWTPLKGQFGSPSPSPHFRRPRVAACLCVKKHWPPRKGSLPSSMKVPLPPIESSTSSHRIIGDRSITPQNQPPRTGLIPQVHQGNCAKLLRHCP